MYIIFFLHFYLHKNALIQAVNAFPFYKRRNKFGRSTWQGRLTPPPPPQKKDSNPGLLTKIPGISTILQLLTIVMNYEINSLP